MVTSRFDLHWKENEVGSSVNLIYPKSETEFALTSLPHSLVFCSLFFSWGGIFPENLCMLCCCSVCI